MIVGRGRAAQAPLPSGLPGPFSASSKGWARLYLQRSLWRKEYEMLVGRGVWGRWAAQPPDPRPARGRSPSNPRPPLVLAAFPTTPSRSS